MTLLNCFIDSTDKLSIPIRSFVKAHFPAWLENQDELMRNWINANAFCAAPGSICLVPNANGELREVLLGLANNENFGAFGALPDQLPAGVYDLDFTEAFEQQQRASLAWGLGSYCFNRYQKKSAPEARLLLSEKMDRQQLNQIVSAIYLVRDLINTPAEDMGPSDLAEAVIQVGKEFGAKTKLIKGDALLKKGYPAVHAVGRSSSREPHFIDMQWGDPKASKLTLVGKGVCFDTGGLDIKTAKGMLLMKKDMSGAAHALGLAKLIMASSLPVRLRLLIPAVDNAISGNSYRPGDVVRTRGGITVEIGNTDAEGRMVLADALSEAVSEKPDQLIDFSSLTGAARVALGPDIPALFCQDEKMAAGILAASEQVKDSIWRLPLHQPYRDYLKSPIADINNCSSTPLAGAITAALFLQAFVTEEVPWAHFDLGAWNYRSQPGHPEGGEAVALRAMFQYLLNKYG